MIPPSFQNQVEMTFIGTATAILNINGVRFITDPVFNAAGTEYEEPTITFKVLTGPALQPHDLPAIDAVLPVLPACIHPMARRPVLSSRPPHSVSALKAYPTPSTSLGTPFISRSSPKCARSSISSLRFSTLVMF
ncbi:hypothetical protein FRC08_001091 [Ceratobasidium sp. 394]|nr:hypothetical protein FRC08_001091 [Ceratobasidium sp. 394]KAG9096540.1 hypothetical protein FS749_008267 [Ceratobasidium sp. UAMH 11750]